MRITKIAFLYFNMFFNFDINNNILSFGANNMETALNTYKFIDFAVLIVGISIS